MNHSSIAPGANSDKSNDDDSSACVPDTVITTCVSPASRSHRRAVCRPLPAADRRAESAFGRDCRLSLRGAFSVTTSRLQGLEPSPGRGGHVLLAMGPDIASSFRATCAPSSVVRCGHRNRSGGLNQPRPLVRLCLRHIQSKLVNQLTL